MLEAREAVKKLHTYRPPLAGRRDCASISTRAHGMFAARAGPAAVARCGLLARYPEREPVEKRLQVFSDSIRHRSCSPTESTKRFICFVPRISILGTRRLSSCPPSPCMRSLLRPKARALSRCAAGDNFAFPDAELLAQISPRTRLIAVANPNNPTGAAVGGQCPHSDCASSAASCPARR